MALDSRPARQDLTSREIAKLLASFCGGLLHMAEPEDLEAAFNHFHEQRSQYLKTWRATKDFIKQVAAEDPSGGFPPI